MLKFTSIVGYTSCGPTYIESFLTIFRQCINVLNYKGRYVSGAFYLGGVMTGYRPQLVHLFKVIFVI